MSFRIIYSYYDYNTLLIVYSVILYYPARNFGESSLVHFIWLLFMVFNFADSLYRKCGDNCSPPFMHFQLF